MDKLRIVGLEDGEGRSVFTFEKTPTFFTTFSRILETLGIDPLHETYDDTNTVDDMTDSVDNKRNELYDIDIFYGEKHIIVVIRSPIPRAQYIHHIQQHADLFPNSGNEQRT